MSICGLVRYTGKDNNEDTTDEFLVKVEKRLAEFQGIDYRGDDNVVDDEADDDNDYNGLSPNEKSKRKFINMCKRQSKRISKKFLELRSKCKEVGLLSSDDEDDEILKQQNERVKFLKLVYGDGGGGSGGDSDSDSDSDGEVGDDDEGAKRLEKIQNARKKKKGIVLKRFSLGRGVVRR